MAVYGCKFLLGNIFFLATFVADKVEYLGLMGFMSCSIMNGHVTLRLALVQ
jgi:hypothetical protein